MRYSSLGQFIDRGKAALAKGPVALIFAEDGVELDSTVQHHRRLGFKDILLCADPDLPVAPDLEEGLHRIAINPHADNVLPDTVNALVAAAPPAIWMYYCYNAEYLFFPFCETRTIRDLLTFQTEERRDAMLTYVIDLYAGDLDRNPNAVCRDEALLDRSGYYALGRKDPEKEWDQKERQLDFYGGLRWRFEEHVTWTKRRIDRISLFKTAPGLKLRGDHTFSIEEYNTYACPWHNNLTAAICSFRTAKALRTNPGSRFDIHSFKWRGSEPFRWHSQQLLDLGLMEPGQWF